MVYSKYSYIFKFSNCPIFDLIGILKFLINSEMAKSPDGSNAWLASRLMADAELLDNNIVTGKKNLVYSWFLYVYFVRQYVTKLRCPITTESWTLFIKEI